MKTGARARERGNLLLLFKVSLSRVANESCDYVCVYACAWHSYFWKIMKLNLPVIAWSCGREERGREEVKKFLYFVPTSTILIRFINFHAGSISKRLEIKFSNIISRTHTHSTHSIWLFLSIIFAKCFCMHKKLIKIQDGKAMARKIHIFCASVWHVWGSKEREMSLNTYWITRTLFYDAMHIFHSPLVCSFILGSLCKPFNTLNFRSN